MGRGLVTIDTLACALQNELDEALALWKTRTHILKYVYDVVYKPHLARSKLVDEPAKVEGESEFMKKFLAGSR